MLDAPSMEGSSERTPSLHPSDELDDDGGLELSLGLSCGGSRNKWKVSEASSPVAAVDVTPELGEVGFENQKYGRGNGLETALKKFLEGRLDEQEESGRLLDGYSQKQGVWELSGSFNKDMGKFSCSSTLSFNSGPSSVRAPSPRNQEPSGQLDSVSDSDKRVTPITFQEIQLSSGMAAAWRHLHPHGMPVQFLDALKSGSSAGGPAAGSGTLLPFSAQGHGDQDMAELQLQVMGQHDELEQQRKFQEARKKRKHLIEEQKQQKKVKREEDKTGPHGFRRPGSNTWVRVDAAAPALDLERAFSTVSENEEGEPSQQETTRDMQQEWDDNKKKDFENKQGESLTPGAKPHDNGSEKSSTSDTPSPGNHSLYRAVSLNHTQDPVLAFCQPHQARDSQFLSSLSVAPVPHFGPLRTLSDPGELRSFKEQVGINAFPGFAASVQVAQGLPGALVPPLTSTEEGDGRHDHLTVGKVGSATQHQVLRSDDSNATEGNNFGQQNIGDTFGGFHRGSTENLHVSDGFTQQLVNLRPGVTPGMKFGGTGSCPDLPWVSTTGIGPNGKTVCGVLYRFSRTQVKIVCACHGKHMSPSEFVQHAGGVDDSNPEKNIVVNPFCLTSQASSS